MHLFLFFVKTSNGKLDKSGLQKSLQKNDSILNSEIIYSLGT